MSRRVRRGQALVPAVLSVLILVSCANEPVRQREPAETAGLTSPPASTTADTTTTVPTSGPESSEPSVDPVPEESSRGRPDDLPPRPTGPSGDRVPTVLPDAPPSRAVEIDGRIG